MNNSLIILSVSNIRISRLLLSDIMLNVIKKNADILIASPFAEDLQFQKDFKCNKIFFHRVDEPKLKRGLITKLYAVSELMRNYGYFRRNRYKGLEYYLINITRENGIDGNDKIDSFKIQIAKKILSFIGLWHCSWRIIDRIIGPFLFRSKNLKKITQNYNNVTLIQASSWGFQDRMLAWNARWLGFRTTFIPYTTDQLYVNGYLLCDYNVICIQGPFEDFCAREYHQISPLRKINLGSMWFRAIDNFILNNPYLQNVDKIKPKTIIYAGLSRFYSPQENEFRSVDALIAANQQGVFGDVKIIYRPGAMTIEERVDIEARYRDAKIELQYPEMACGGMNNYPSDSIKIQLKNYIENLLKTDVLIMAQTTSLALDASYLNCAVIADFTDSVGVFKQRKTHLCFANNADHPCLPGASVVRSHFELINKIKLFLTDDEAAKNSASAIRRAWDYKPEKWELLLEKAVCGDDITDYSTNNLKIGSFK